MTNVRTLNAKGASNTIWISTRLNLMAALLLRYYFKIKFILTLRLIHTFLLETWDICHDFLTKNYIYTNVHMLRPRT